MVLKRRASNFFKPKDRVLKKKTVLYENSRPLQSINADKCTVLQQCWKRQSIIRHCPTKFRNCTANFAIWSDMTSQLFPLKILFSNQICFEPYLNDNLITDIARHVLFCCNTLTLYTNFYSRKKTVQKQLKTNVHVCFII